MALAGLSRRRVAGRGTSSISATACCRRPRSSISSDWWSSCMPHSHTAVLLMAYGSPNRLDEVEAYYTDIRGGRKPKSEAVAELRAKYQRVGVPTPLLAVSAELSRRLERQLNADPPDE